MAIVQVPSTSYRGVSLFQSSAGTQSIPGSTDTTLTYDSEQWDTDGFHSTSTNTSRITIPAGLAGKYLISCSTSYGLNATGQRALYLRKNGTNVKYFPGVAGSSSVYTANHSSFVLNLAVGDYIEMIVYQDSGGSLTYYKRQEDAPFQATYLGA
jgi:hypothetical protein